MMSVASFQSLTATVLKVCIFQPCILSCVMNILYMNVIWHLLLFALSTLCFCLAILEMMTGDFALSPVLLLLKLCVNRINILLRQSQLKLAYQSMLHVA